MPRFRKFAADGLAARGTLRARHSTGEIPLSHLGHDGAPRGGVNLNRRRSASGGYGPTARSGSAIHDGGEQEAIRTRGKIPEGSRAGPAHWTTDDRIRAEIVIVDQKAFDDVSAKQHRRQHNDRGNGGTVAKHRIVGGRSAGGNSRALLPHLVEG